MPFLFVAIIAAVLACGYGWIANIVYIVAFVFPIGIVLGYV